MSDSTIVCPRCLTSSMVTASQVLGHKYKCGKCLHLFDKSAGNRLPESLSSGASPANEVQHGGTHYKNKAIQPWDYIASNKLGYFEGNIVKYVSRWRDKGGAEDLKKARHYLDKLLELSEAERKDKGENNAET